MLDIGAMHCVWWIRSVELWAFINSILKKVKINSIVISVRKPKLFALARCFARWIWQILSQFRWFVFVRFRLKTCMFSHCCGDQLTTRILVSRWWWYLFSRSLGLCELLLMLRDSAGFKTYLQVPSWHLLNWSSIRRSQVIYVNVKLHSRVFFHVDGVTRVLFFMTFDDTCLNTRSLLRMLSLVFTQRLLLS